MHYTKVLSGLMRYIDSAVLPGMNDVQEFGYLALCETLKDNPEPVMRLLEKNVFARVLLSADKEGDINMERVANAAKKAIQRKGKIDFSIPGFGKFGLSEEDIDQIIRTVMEGQT